MILVKIFADFSCQKLRFVVILVLMKQNERENGDEKGGGNYPYCTLAVCLDVVEAIRSLGGGKSPVSKALLASHLKEEEASQVLSFKLASSKSFGLISGRSDYSLTEIAQHYFLPTGESDRKNTLLDALEYCPAFKMLAERFDGGKLPPQEMLGNILRREELAPESWKDRVAGIFIKSAAFAEALDKDGFLRIKALRDRATGQNVKIKESDKIEEKANAPLPTQDVKPQSVPQNLNTLPVTWTFNDGDLVLMVQTPKTLTENQWTILNQYVQWLNPKEKAK